MLWKLCRIFLKYRVFNIYSDEGKKDLYRIYIGFIWDLHGIYMGFIWDLYQKYYKYHKLIDIYLNKYPSYL